MSVHAGKEGEDHATPEPAEADEAERKGLETARDVVRRDVNERVRHARRDVAPGECDHDGTCRAGLNCEHDKRVEKNWRLELVVHVIGKLTHAPRPRFPGECDVAKAHFAATHRPNPRTA